MTLFLLKWAHLAFCFTNLTFEAVDSLLSEAVTAKLEVQNSQLSTTGSMCARYTHKRNGWGLEILVNAVE